MVVPFQVLYRSPFLLMEVIKPSVIQGLTCQLRLDNLGLSSLKKLSILAL